MKRHQRQKWLILLIAALSSFIIAIVWQQIFTPVEAETKPELSTPTKESALLNLAKVSDGIYALIANTDYPPPEPNIAICNAGIVIGTEGVLVIDPFQNEALGNLLLAEVRKITDLPIKYVLNTHFHFDHTGGNIAIKNQDIPILGRGTIRQDMLAKNLEYDPNPTPPDIVLQDDGNIWLGDIPTQPGKAREIKLEAVEGHSGGTDIIAYIPDANVLFAGDILFNRRIPYISDGNINQWQATLEKLEKTYTNAIMVPGHGQIGDRIAAKELYNYLADLKSLALQWQAKGLSKAEAIKTSTAIPAKYKTYKFQALYPTNLEAAYQQIILNSK